MKNSNVAIDQTTNEALSEFCTRTKLTKKDFITISLKYFNDYAINPSKHEKPTQEIEKMHKRIEDVFKFIKAQERDILKPFLVQVAKSNIEHKDEITSLRNSINLFVNKNIEQNKERLILEQKAHQDQIKILQEQKEGLLKDQQQMRQIILQLGQTLEEKNKGIFDNFKKILK
ncbi:MULTISPECIES: BfmA/BtgA family mobilization protein [unclassified Flavobacterium]|uniref:BfmA/BtgA family mobilization protein n=1 Tax=unclassified Flavobacterium TaxID=196869 RepID=UPI00131D62E7|nr:MULTISPECIES: BfmA/BtgA family mobilization protein [unclassified Flavobacterium]